MRRILLQAASPSTFP